MPDDIKAYNSAAPLSIEPKEYVYAQTRRDG
jgi:hypothetical protein